MTDTSVCSIPECGRATVAKGFCQKHYNRFRANGDPMAVKGTPKGEAQEFFQSVVLQYEGAECLKWPYGHAKGYGVLKNGTRMVRVARLVCEYSNGEPPTPEHQAAHSCGKGHEGCVTKGHLSWKTPKENQSDRITHGTHNRGENNGFAKLSEAQARRILSLKGKEAQRETALRFGIAAVTVSQIHTGKNWGWLQTKDERVQQ